MITINEQKNKAVSFLKMLEEKRKRPKRKFLWRGIKVKSFGIIFGPSKSGKTIFCENLAIKLAIGSASFLGFKLPGKPTKVLFVGLEEFWENRLDRNWEQYLALNEDEKKAFEENYLYQHMDFHRHLTTSTHWANFKDLIINSQAEVVFVDSITRLNHGILEDSKTAEEIMQRLHEIAIETNITLICVHHTPKMHEAPITMDKIKGSSVFAQESDFAYGINRTSKGIRYLKTVFLRYADDTEEKVKEFVINKSLWIEIQGEDYEEVLLQKSDRRRDDDKRDLIIKTVDNYYCKLISTKVLVDSLMPILGIQERQIKTLLKELVTEKKIGSPKRGYYESVNCTNKEGGNDEEE